MNDSSTLQQIMQEQFTFLLTEEKGIKECQSQANTFLLIVRLDLVAIL